MASSLAVNRSRANAPLPPAKGTPAHEIAAEIFRLATELNEALRSAANAVGTELRIEEMHEVSGAGAYVQLVVIPRKRLTRHSDNPVE